MSHIRKVNRLLRPQKKIVFSGVDLFAGCGGLSLGFEAQGFQVTGYESDINAVSTYNANLQGRCHHTHLDKNSKYSKVDILIAGPPCQPFSVLGKGHGIDDIRDGFPICIEAIRQVKPKLFVLENVKGLVTSNNSYLKKIIKRLTGLGYKVSVKLLNAKNFDVPQNRVRLFIVGVKKGVFAFPNEKKYTITAGTALGSLVKKTPFKHMFLTRKMMQYVGRYEKASKCSTKRDLHLDKPARTLTCRNLAGMTGDMHRILIGKRRRRLEVREAARLQSFPDWFHFLGQPNHSYHQIGNAVPPMMAFYIAKAAKNYLNKYYRR
jgi:DNA (cytosine-5)-methyltransferase 1